MKTWFTSDMHLRHEFVARLRGFPDSKAHDAHVVEQWSKVGRNDVVWILGDLCLGDFRDALDILAELPGRKRLVLGNHDMGHPMHRRAARYFHCYTGIFDSVSTVQALRVGDVKVILSHFPYVGDHTEKERFGQWRVRDLGTPVIHGHTHSGDRLSYSTTGTRQVNVALDAWKYDLAPEGAVHALLDA